MTPPANPPPSGMPGQGQEPKDLLELARQRQERARLEHGRFLEMVRLKAGRKAEDAVNFYWGRPYPQTWPEAVAVLAKGITVHLSCRNAQSVPVLHQVRFDPDGSVVPLQHPGEDLSAEREATERLLAGLGEIGSTRQTLGISDCVHMALALPLRAPLLNERPDGNQNPLHAGPPLLSVSLRTLHAMVRNAADPDGKWEPRLGDLTLSHGITTADIRAYQQAGFALNDAIAWLQWRVPIDTALRWHEVGRRGTANAMRCARGEPLNSEWDQTGMDAKHVVAWQAVGDIRPHEAADWHRRGLTPRQYRLVHAKAAEISPYPHLAPLAIRATGETVTAWVDRGVAAGSVTEWLFETLLDLNFVLRWERTGLTYRHWQMMSREVPEQMPPGWGRPRPLGSRPTRSAVGASGAAGAATRAGRTTLPSLPGPQAPPRLSREHLAFLAPEPLAEFLPLLADDDMSAWEVVPHLGGLGYTGAHLAAQADLLAAQYPNMEPADRVWLVLERWRQAVNPPPTQDESAGTGTSQGSADHEPQ